MTYSSYQVTAIIRIKSYYYLGIYPEKASGAWAEVSTGPWFPTAPIMAPGGRDLGDFFGF